MENLSEFKKHIGYDYMIRSNIDEGDNTMTVYGIGDVNFDPNVDGDVLVFLVDRTNKTVHINSINSFKQIKFDHWSKFGLDKYNSFVFKTSVTADGFSPKIDGMVGYNLSKPSYTVNIDRSEAVCIENYVLNKIYGKQYCKESQL